MTEPCREYGDRLDGLIDEELSDSEAQAVEAHAGTCEACSAYLAEGTRLRDGLGRIALVQESPGVVDAVRNRIRGGILVRNGFLVTGLLMLRVLDLFGVFGSGLLPRVVVAAAVLAAFLVMRLNPFRLIDVKEYRPAVLPVKGGAS